MAKRKRLTYIEILLILAIIAILVVWLFPRFLKMLNSKPAEIGMIRPSIGIDYSIRKPLVLPARIEMTLPMPGERGSLI